MSLLLIDINHKRKIIMSTYFTRILCYIFQMWYYINLKEKMLFVAYKRNDVSNWSPKSVVLRQLYFHDSKKVPLLPKSNWRELFKKMDLSIENSQKEDLEEAIDLDVITTSNHSVINRQSLSVKLNLTEILSGAATKDPKVEIFIEINYKIDKSFMINSLAKQWFKMSVEAKHDAYGALIQFIVECFDRQYELMPLFKNERAQLALISGLITLNLASRCLLDVYIDKLGKTLSLSVVHREFPNHGWQVTHPLCLGIATNRVLGSINPHPKIITDSTKGTSGAVDLRGSFMAFRQSKLSPTQSIVSTMCTHVRNIVNEKQVATNEFQAKITTNMRRLMSIYQFTEIHELNLFLIGDFLSANCFDAYKSFNTDFEANNILTLNIKSSLKHTLMQINIFLAHYEPSESLIFPPVEEVNRYFQVNVSVDISKGRAEVSVVDQDLPATPKIARLSDMDLQIYQFFQIQAEMPQLKHTNSAMARIKQWLHDVIDKYIVHKFIRNAHQFDLFLKGAICTNFHCPVSCRLVKDSIIFLKHLSDEWTPTSNQVDTTFLHVGLEKSTMTGNKWDAVLESYLQLPKFAQEAMQPNVVSLFVQENGMSNFDKIVIENMINYNVTKEEETLTCNTKAKHCKTNDLLTISEAETAAYILCLAQNLLQVGHFDRAKYLDPRIKVNLEALINELPNNKQKHQIDGLVTSYNANFSTWSQLESIIVCQDELIQYLSPNTTLIASYRTMSQYIEFNQTGSVGKTGKFLSFTKPSSAISILPVTVAPHVLLCQIYKILCDHDMSNYETINGSEINLPTHTFSVFSTYETDFQSKPVINLKTIPKLQTLSKVYHQQTTEIDHFHTLHTNKEFLKTTRKSFIVKILEELEPIVVQRRLNKNLINDRLQRFRQGKFSYGIFGLETLCCNQSMNNYIDLTEPSDVSWTKTEFPHTSPPIELKCYPSTRHVDTLTDFEQFWLHDVVFFNVFKNPFTDRFHENEERQALVCNNAIGVTFVNKGKTKPPCRALIELFNGTDVLKCEPNCSCLVTIGNGDKQIYGSDEDDIFVLIGDQVTSGTIQGNKGVNTLSLTGYARSYEKLLELTLIKETPTPAGETTSQSMQITDIHKVLGRAEHSDHITCDSRIGFIGTGGAGGKTPHNQVTILADLACYNLTVIVESKTYIKSSAICGTVNYILVYDDLGHCAIDLINVGSAESWIWMHFSIETLLSIDLFSVRDVTLKTAKTSVKINNFPKASLVFDEGLLQIKDNHIVHSSPNDTAYEKLVQMAIRLNVTVIGRQFDSTGYKLVVNSPDFPNNYHTGVVEVQAATQGVKLGSLMPNTIYQLDFNPNPTDTRYISDQYSVLIDLNLNHKTNGSETIDLSSIVDDLPQESYLSYQIVSNSKHMLILDILAIHTDQMDRLFQISLQNLHRNDWYTNVEIVLQSALTIVKTNRDTYQVVSKRIKIDQPGSIAIFTNKDLNTNSVIKISNIPGTFYPFYFNRQLVVTNYRLQHNSHLNFKHHGAIMIFKEYFDAENLHGTIVEYENGILRLEKEIVDGFAVPLQKILVDEIMFLQAFLSSVID